MYITDRSFPTTASSWLVATNYNICFFGKISLRISTEVAVWTYAVGGTLSFILSKKTSDLVKADWVKRNQVENPFSCVLRLGIMNWKKIIVKTLVEKNVGSYQHTRSPSTEWGECYEDCVHDTRIFLWAPNLQMRMLLSHMLIQFRSFRETMVFTVDATSRAIGHLAHKWPVPHCVMVNHLVFAA